jgi:hypothetical protein
MESKKICFDLSLDMVRLVESIAKPMQISRADFIRICLYRELIRLGYVKPENAPLEMRSLHELEGGERS